MSVRKYRCIRALRVLTGSLGSLPWGLPTSLPRTPDKQEGAQCPGLGLPLQLWLLLAEAVRWARAASTCLDALGRPWCFWSSAGAWGTLMKPISRGEHRCTSLKSSFIFVMPYPANSTTCWERVWKYQAASYTHVLFGIHYHSQDENVISLSMQYSVTTMR